MTSHEKVLRYLKKENALLTAHLENEKLINHFDRLTFAYLLEQPWFLAHLEEVKKHIRENIIKS